MKLLFIKGGKNVVSSKIFQIVPLTSHQIFELHGSTRETRHTTFDEMNTLSHIDTKISYSTQLTAVLPNTLVSNNIKILPSYLNVTIDHLTTMIKNRYIKARHLHSLTKITLNRDIK